MEEEDLSDGTGVSDVTVLFDLSELFVGLSILQIRPTNICLYRRIFQFLLVILKQK